MASWLPHPLLRGKVSCVDQNITFVRAKMLSPEEQAQLEAETGLVVHPEVGSRMVYGMKGGFPTGLKKIPADTTLDYDAFHERYPASPLELLSAGERLPEAPIEKLPTEIILNIFSMLNMPALDSARFVCKSWYALIMTDELLLHKHACPHAAPLVRNRRAHAREFERRIWRNSSSRTPKIRYRQCDIIFSSPEPGQKTVLVSITHSCTLLAMVTLGNSGYTLLVYHLNAVGKPCLVKGIALSARPLGLSIKNNPAAQFGSIVTLSYGQKTEQFEVVQRLTVRRIDNQWTSVFDLYRSTHVPGPRVIQRPSGPVHDWTLVKHLSLEHHHIENESAYRKRPYHIARHRNGRLYFVQLMYDPEPWVKPLVLISAPYEDAEIVNISIEPYQELVVRYLQLAIIWRGQSSPLSAPRNTLFVYEIECPRRFDWGTPQNGPLMRFPDCWKIDLDGNFVGDLPSPVDRRHAAESKQRSLEEAVRCSTAYGYRIGNLPSGFGGQWAQSSIEIPKKEAREKFDPTNDKHKGKANGSFSVSADEETSTSGMRLFCTGSHLALWGLTNDGGLHLRFIQMQTLHANQKYVPQWDLGHESTCGCALHDYGWLVVNPVLQHPFPAAAQSGFFSQADARLIPDARIKAEEVQYLVTKDRLAAIKRVEAAVLANAVEKAAKMAAIRNDHIEEKPQASSVVPPSLLTLHSRSVLRDVSFSNARREFRRVYEAITGSRANV